jgi:asparagine synthase (glutamine-hydrolysing)
MCGIVGVLNLNEKPPVEASTLHRMLAMLRHRGPDALGIFRDSQVGLGNARLSIIDLSGGDQPIGNEDGTLWIVFNGEVFNYVELRPQLEARGHRFSTASDTEVIVHLYEEYGSDCLTLLNGQFALAIWDRRKRSLLMARDRFGVRPLFYTIHEGRLLFGSEIKSILAYPGLSAHIDPASLDQIFTFWSTLSPRTMFRSIDDVPPGHYLRVEDGHITIDPYWTIDFKPVSNTQRSPQEYLEEFQHLLVDATRIRLRADVPVGAYLSGGLDSSTTTALIRTYTDTRLDTFSIAFVDDPEFDESAFQQRMAAFLGTNHHVSECTHADIGRVFPEVIWHTETAIMRTAPAPMFLLAKLVHEHNFKVVVTGEGADEFLAGYDIFKEMKVRRFWAEHPDSHLRPLLLKRLYPDIVGLSTSSAYLTAFFKRGLTETASPYYSHSIRWGNTARTRRFLCNSTPAGLGTIDHRQLPLLPSAFTTWPHLAQAQYLEISTFLSQYLLSSQGDRMAMAHSVEGRFPFLDCRVVEFCNRLPPGLKMPGLKEKWLLKQLGRRLVPTEIWRRPKRPYRAPIHRSFFGRCTPDYVQDLLSERALRESGLFNPVAVARLGRKAAVGERLSEVDDMALVGILSTQLVYQQFVKEFRIVPVQSGDPVKVVDYVTVR